MSNIEYVKSRLGEMFLRDRGNVDEKTAALIKSELKQYLGRFFILKEYSAEFSSCDNGEVALSLRAAGRRLRTAETE